MNYDKDNKGVSKTNNNNPKNQEQEMKKMFEFAKKNEDKIIKIQAVWKGYYHRKIHRLAVINLDPKPQ